MPFAMPNGKPKEAEVPQFRYFRRGKGGAEWFPNMEKPAFLTQRPRG